VADSLEKKMYLSQVNTLKSIARTHTHTLE
jgi:hypothetical protein